MSTDYEKMDRMYRHQRYFYDATRKYYLLGRDRLLGEMDIREGGRVLEVGCGTGRNLLILAKRHPAARFYGLDASAEMLRTARRKAVRAGLENVRFERALAGDFTHRETFGLGRPFDAVFFSYALSIIPDWRPALENGLENLRSGGSLHIVDFYDQAELPAVFRKLLRGWLKKFGVGYPRELIPRLRELERAGKGRLRVRPVHRRYAFVAHFEKN